MSPEIQPQVNVKRDVHRRSRRLVAWASAAVTAAALLTLLFVLRVPSGGGVSTEPAALVESLVGTVWVRGTDTPVSRFLLVDSAVSVGSGLRSAANGRASLRLPSGHSLRLDYSTQVRLLGDGRVALDGGRIYVDPGTAHDGGAGLSVTTPSGEVRGTGARFEVRLQHEGLRVRVREGSVDLVRDGVDPLVVEGGEVSVDPDGRVTRREISSNGPEWDWLARS